jgi:hypothetical protein
MTWVRTQFLGRPKGRAIGEPDLIDKPWSDAGDASEALTP